MRKRIIILICILFSITKIYGQFITNISDITNPQVILPSPQARLFEQYVTHPVASYNGLAEIKIPLYEINIKGLNIPVYLSYHASGIKHTQDSGDVGVGWTLNLGGFRVNRNVYGYPDEERPYYKKEDIEKLTDPWDIDAYLGGLTHLSNFLSLAKLSQKSWESADADYDLFTYMLPTANGHFLISDRNSKIVEIVEGTNEKVIFDSQSDKLLLNEMIISDDKGFEYLFGKYSDGTLVSEKTKLGPPRGAVKTSWPLTKITSPYNEVINLRYDKVESATSYEGRMITITEAADASFCSLSFEACQEYALGEENKATSNPQPIEGIWNDIQLLSYMETPNEVLQIERDTDSRKSINTITIKDKQGKRIKKITFLYEERNPSSDFPTILKAIKIDGENDISPQIYNLDYYDGPGKVTHLTSAYSDAWGYYMDEQSSGEFPIDQNLGNVDIVYSNYGPGGSTRSGLLRDVYSFFAPEIKFIDKLDIKVAPTYFSLKKITYPTGGSIEYIYESHQFNSIYSSKGAGLRIKKILSKASDSEEPALITEYRYGENENGFARPIISEYIDDILTNSYNKSDFYLMEYIYLITIIGDYEHKEPRWIKRFFYKSHHFYSKPQSGLLDAGSYGTYDEVAVYQYDNSNNFNGKTIAKYNLRSPYQFERDFRNNLFISNRTPGYQSNIKQQQTFDKEGKLINEVEFKYTDSKRSLSQAYNGIHIYPINTIPEQFFDHFRAPEAYQGGFDRLLWWFPTSYRMGGFLLSSKISKNYFYDKGETRIVSTTETYQYNEKNQLKSESKTTNNSFPLITNYKYSWEYSVAPYTDMFSKNIISPVIEQVKTNNNREIERIKTNYIKESVRTKNLILIDDIQTSLSGINNLRTEITYDLYDERGNPLQYTGKDGIPVSYIWSYNYQYPIAEFKGMTYDEAKTKMNTYLGVDITAQKSLSTTIENKIKMFPTSTNVPQGALVTTYTYKPSVGMTSATDPSGRTVSYNYDSFGRLQNIKDHEGKIVEGYEYNYRNQ